MTSSKRRPSRLNRASAYYRLAAKAERSGNVLMAQLYHSIADNLVKENRREQERRQQQTHLKRIK